MNNSRQSQSKVPRIPQVRDKSQDSPLEPEYSLPLFKEAKEMKSQNLLIGDKFLLSIQAISGTSISDAYTVIPGNTAVKAEHFYAGEKTGPESSLVS